MRFTGSEPINNVARSVSGFKDRLRKVVVVVEYLADAVCVTGIQESKWKWKSPSKSGLLRLRL